MSVTRRFSCNLCGDEYDRAALFGVYFHGKQSFEFREPVTCERHICRMCAARVTKLYGAIQADALDDAGEG